MKLKKLFFFTIVFFLQALSISLVASEDNKQLAQLIDMSGDLLPVIAQSFQLKEMNSWKRTCKNFNAKTDYQCIALEIIKSENHDTCTDGLIYFAHTAQECNFKHLFNNNACVRIVNVQGLGWKSITSIYDLMDAYTGFSITSGVQFSKIITQLDIQKILCSSNNENIQNDRGDTILHYVCNEGDIETIKRFLSNVKIDVNIRNQYGDTALCYACENNNIELVELLLAHENINPNVQDKYEKTILHNASERKIDSKIIKLLLAHKKTNPNIQDDCLCTPLHWACIERNIKVVKWLLRNKRIDCTIQDKNGDTALDIVRWESRWASREILKMLEAFL